MAEDNITDTRLPGRVAANNTGANIYLSKLVLMQLGLTIEDPIDAMITIIDNKTIQISLERSDV